MEKDHDLDLAGLFDDSPAPSDGEAFVRRFSQRITTRRYLRRAFKPALASAVVVTALLMSLTGFLATGANLFAQVMTSLFLTPAGLVLGGGAGLFFFLRAR